jgi:predicted membrane protein
LVERVRRERAVALLQDKEMSAPDNKLCILQEPKQVLVRLKVFSLSFNAPPTRVCIFISSLFYFHFFFFLSSIFSLMYYIDNIIYIYIHIYMQIFKKKKKKGGSFGISNHQ